MVVNLGETEVFERQMAEPFDGIVWRNLFLADLFEQLSQRVGVHIRVFGLGSVQPNVIVDGARVTVDGF